MKHFTLMTSKEPTDSQLSNLMKGVARDVRKKISATKKKMAKQITQEIKNAQARFKAKK